MDKASPNGQTSTDELPRIALTMGDPAGIGPEVIVRFLDRMKAEPICRPLVIGHTELLNEVAARIDSPSRFAEIETDPTEVSSTNWPVLDPTHDLSLTSELIGKVHAYCGEAAFRCLSTAIDLAQEGRVDAITTAPLNKESLHLAGHDYPGHTEILAERCGVDEFAMMLYLPPGELVRSEAGFGVAHVTLHTSIQSVPGLLSTEKIRETIGLIDDFTGKVLGRKPRIGVCALNPHGGEHGLFGDEEARLIEPAVREAVSAGLNVQGPFPADTLLLRASHGEFDGIVAMYHDQGHIALKLLAFGRAVNVTLGLPFVRTSPSHGTAFDIAAEYSADETGLWYAVKVATDLVNNKQV